MKHLEGKILEFHVKFYYGIVFPLMCDPSSKQGKLSWHMLVGGGGGLKMCAYVWNSCFKPILTLIRDQRP